MPSQKSLFRSIFVPEQPIAVFNIRPVALVPRALQRSVSPNNKDSLGLCHPHKALFLSAPSCRPLELISRLCHFSQRGRAGVVLPPRPLHRAVLCCFWLIAPPSSVTP